MIASRSLSSGRKALERRLGLSVRRFPVVGTLAGDLRSLVANLAIDGIIDVGGHHGQFGRFLREDVGYRGPINSFEPYPESFAVLEMASRDDAKWQVHNTAIGTESGTKELLVYAETDFNSFHRLSTESHTQYDGVEPVSSVSVQVSRLDDLYESDWGHRLLLKSDTQGNDLVTIDSAEAILEKIWGIQVEAGVVPIYDNAPSLSETVDQLLSLGFGASSFHPVGYHKDPRAIVEFDIVFVRR